MESSALDFLAALCAAPGPVGQEAPVVACWLDYLRPYADEVFTDAYGNGYAVLNPKGDPCVLLTGHADELGLMVSQIDEGGFLWVARLGGYDPKVLPGMRVRIFGSGPAAAGAALPGVVGALPPHMQRGVGGDPEFKVYKFGENVYVDIGAKDQADAARHVRVGDSMVVDYGYRQLTDKLAVGRGLDNKIGLWAAAEALRRVAAARKSARTTRGAAAKIVAMAAVQEEIGGHGARMAAFRVNPDIAIAIDVTQSIDHPGTDKRRFGDVKLGLGPVLGHGSANHRELVARLEKVAASRRISVQHEAAPRYTGTDADSIYTVREGIPSAVVSLPQRYMHSPAELINLADLEQLSELLQAFCSGLKKGERFAVAV